MEKEELTRLKEVIKNLTIEGKHIRSLDFSQNHLSSYFKENPFFLRSFVRLKEINLGNCDLDFSSLSSDQLPESIEKIVANENKGIKINLQNSPKLKEIELKECNLSSLSSDQLPESIEKIDAEKNTGIQINLKNSPKLKEINLRYCNLSSLGQVPLKLDTECIPVYF